MKVIIIISFLMKSNEGYLHIDNFIDHPWDQWKWKKAYKLRIVNVELKMEQLWNLQQISTEDMISQLQSLQ